MREFLRDFFVLFLVSFQRNHSFQHFLQQKVKAALQCFSIAIGKQRWVSVCSHPVRWFRGLSEKKQAFFCFSPKLSRLEADSCCHLSFLPPKEPPPIPTTNTLLKAVQSSPPAQQTPDAQPCLTYLHARSDPHKAIQIPLSTRTAPFRGRSI